MHGCENGFAVGTHGNILSAGRQNWRLDRLLTGIVDYGDIALPVFNDRGDAAGGHHLIRSENRDCRHLFVVLCIHDDDRIGELIREQHALLQSSGGCTLARGFVSSTAGQKKCQ